MAVVVAMIGVAVVVMVNAVGVVVVVVMRGVWALSVTATRHIKGGNTRGREKCLAGDGRV